jgi:hypothetical protein
MVLTNQGNVGIGTTSPDANLDVFSSGKVITNTAYKTKSWAQMKTEIESQGGYIQTRDQLLSLESSLLQSGQDKWAAGVTRLGGGEAYKQWYQIGNSNHVYGREHPNYPSWGDGTVSHSFRDTIAIVSKPLKINHGFFINHYEHSDAWGQAVFQMVGASTNYCTMGFTKGTDSGSNDNVLEAISFTRNGKVGIGTTSPSISLDVHGTYLGRYYNFGSCHDADKRNSFYIGRWDGTTQSGAFLGMQLKVDTHDNMGYGSYDNQASIIFQTWGNNYATSREIMEITANGYVRGINAYQNDSDDRIKHNEKNINAGLNVINKLQAKEYFKTSTLFDENGNIYDSNHNFNLNIDGLPIDASGEVLTDVNKEIGFIAQEVFEIDELKHAVREGNLVSDASGNMYKNKFGLSYEEIFVMNVVATQELDRQQQADKARISDLEAKNTALENTVQTLISRITALENNSTN